MARGKHAKRKPAPRQSPPPPPPRPHLLPSATSGIVQRADGTTARAIFKLGGAEDRCSDCDEVLVDKFDTSLMCSLGHMTCFPCVAKSKVDVTHAREQRLARLRRSLLGCNRVVGR